MKQTLDIKRIDMTLRADTPFGAMSEAVTKYGYSVFNADEPNAYTLRKEAGLRAVNILVWFDEDNQLHCTKSNVDVLQAMGLNPIAEAEHPAASAQYTQVGGNHYKDMKIQPWAVMRATFTRDEMIGYHVGTVMAYLMRHKAKGGEQDIKKAQHHLTELVEYLNAA